MRADMLRIAWFAGTSSNELPPRIIAEIAGGLCPALQRRGLIPRDYPHRTFRENLASF